MVGANGCGKTTLPMLASPAAEARRLREHLGLSAMECLEEALAGFPATLVLVSHDLRFLDRLATRRWRRVPVEFDRWTLVESP